MGDRGRKRARAVVDKEMTLQLRVGENYLILHRLPRLILLHLSVLGSGELWGLT